MNARSRSRSPSPLVRIAAGLVGAVFVAAGALQYNNPDPLAWGAIFLAAAGVSFAVAGGWRVPGWAPAVIGIAAVVWAGRLLPRVVGHVPVTELIQERAARTPLIAEGRGALGLVAIAAWMAVLAFAVSRRPRDADPASLPRS